MLGRQTKTIMNLVRFYFEIPSSGKVSMLKAKVFLSSRQMIRSLNTIVRNFGLYSEIARYLHQVAKGVYAEQQGFIFISLDDQISQNTIVRNFGKTEILAEIDFFC